MRVFEYVVTCGYYGNCTEETDPAPGVRAATSAGLGEAVASRRSCLISPTGERIELPGTLVEVLRTAVEFMSHGQTVTLIPDNQAITTQRAADILGMSRPFFIKQLESGLMAHHRVGHQRRVYLCDVLEFAKQRDKEQERMAALDLLARDAFEAGRLHERNVFPEARTSEECSSRCPGCLRPGPNALG